jgi:hypothetical protein
VRVPDQLRIAWSAGSAFLDALDREGAGRYSVAMPGTDRVLRGAPIGERVTVELEFLDTQRTFRHIARVVEHDPGPPEIVTFEFLAEQRAVRELIVCHAEGGVVPYLNRRAVRKLVWLPVEVRIADQQRRGFVTEMSELGAFVAMPNPPPAEKRVQLQIRTEDGPRLEVTARVVYAHARGPRVGFAGEFAFTNRDDEVRIRRAVRAALQAPKRS